MPWAIESRPLSPFIQRLPQIATSSPHTQPQAQSRSHHQHANAAWYTIISKVLVLICHKYKLGAATALAHMPVTGYSVIAPCCQCPSVYTPLLPQAGNRPLPWQTVPWLGQPMLFRDVTRMSPV